MIEEFRIDGEWPIPPRAGERDVAHIRISAENTPLIRLVDLEAKEERDYVRSSAVSLALWLADNWWRLRYESLPNGSTPSPDWRLRHELTSVPGGALWPPIMIHSTGDRVLATHTFGKPLDVGSLRYFLRPVTSVSGAGYETGVDAFFNQVLEICSGAQDGKALGSVVSALRRERENLEFSAWRQLEARLGFDPGGAPDGLVQKLSTLETKVGEAGLDEAASAVPGSRSADFLEKSVEAAKNSEITADWEVTDNLPRDRIRVGAAPPWKLAREAAYQVRQAASLHDGPIKGAPFADLFRAPEEELKKKPATARRLPYGIRLESNGRRQKLAVQSANFRDRRFELACALGDSVWVKSGFGVTSRAKTDRQKFQRAFAQNFLAPFADVKRHIDLVSPTSDQIEQAAKLFYVNPNVIRRLLMLEGVITDLTWDDQLESA
jgi:hypothetical protein